MSTSDFEHRAAPDRQWTLVRLKDQCRRVRNGVLRRNLCSEAEVDALEPPDDNYNKWIHYYAQLWRIYEREKFITHGSEYASKKLLDAMCDEPVEVELTDGTTVNVYPKSETALRVLELQYRILNWLNVRVIEIQRQADEHEKLVEEGKTPHEGVTEPFSVLEAAIEEQNYRLGLILWIACTPGVRLPWPYSESTPEPHAVPNRWLDLHPMDVTRIENAIPEANAWRLRFLPKPKERGHGVTVDQFFAQRAKATGSPVRHLRMEQSLASQIAEVVLAGHREEVA